MPNACMRPPGSSIRYCCSGRTPNVYLISKSARLPSGPSVFTKYLPSRVEKVVTESFWTNFAPLKSPCTDLRIGDLHGEVVVGSAPGLRLLRMTSRARRDADELRVGGRCHRGRGGTRGPLRHAVVDSGTGDRQQRHGSREERPSRRYGLRCRLRRRGFLARGRLPVFAGHPLLTHDQDAEATPGLNFEDSHHGEHA